jgi:hypothetical protein
VGEAREDVNCVPIQGLGREGGASRPLLTSDYENRDRTTPTNARDRLGRLRPYVQHGEREEPPERERRLDLVPAPASILLLSQFGSALASAGLRPPVVAKKSTQNSLIFNRKPRGAKSSQCFRAHLYSAL